MALVNAIEIVNQGFLKAVPINQRFDASIIEPHLNIIDSRYLKTIFCTAFYDALIAAKDGIGQYNADLGATSIAFSTNANYETLYKEYIQKNNFLMIRRPPRSTRKESSAASDVYKRQDI